MRFNKLLEAVVTEASQRGAGVTFVDIDETVFKTFAKIIVRDASGKQVRELSNAEFNAYDLKDGEEYDFGQFKDAKFFKKTSIPIPETVSRLQKMITQIREKKLKSKVIFLTARADFDNKQELLQSFRDIGIDIDWTDQVYIERVGNIKSGTIPEKKKNVILKYMKTGEFRRVRLVDDFKDNVLALQQIKDSLPKDIEDKVRKRYSVPEGVEAIEFHGLWIQPNGKLKKLV